MKKTLTLLLCSLLFCAAFSQADPICQSILPVLQNSTPVVNPANPINLDICLGASISLEGAALFPENGLYYTQSEATAVFTWDFGDGTLVEGKNASHTYAQAGGYFITLFIRDHMGCTNAEVLQLRARVAAPPTVAIGQTGGLTPGAPVSLKANYAPVKSLNFPDSLSFNVPTPLPDGNGAFVEMSISVGGYPAGQTLQAGQIQSVCLNIEHSWLRDMEIKLACPNGQSVILHNFAGQLGGEVFLGVPDETDEGLALPIPGIGYPYCWTPDGTQTWIEYANVTPSGTLPVGNYKSFEPLSNLEGCPLDGDWTLAGTDLWPIDNGYLFSWKMEFDTTLFAPPAPQQFDALVTNAAWQSDNTIIYYSPDSIVVMPVTGDETYVFDIENNFGCQTTAAAQVEMPNPDCPGAGAGMEVTATASSSALSEMLAGNGVIVVSHSLNAGAGATGTFEHGGEAICIEKGILLTTGSATSNGNTFFGADEVGTSFASNTNNSTATDPDLDLLVMPGAGAFDAAVFTMQFIPAGDSISFRYVFGSEEYPEYACTPFNDVFGFIVSGPGISGPFSSNGKNIALVPGTNLPVSIGNVHPANGPNCPDTHIEFYNAHQLSDQQPVYDGILDVLTAGAKVIPCETYTLKLLIADVSDQVFDSGVFLEAESFTSTSNTVAHNLPDPADPIREGWVVPPLAFDFSDFLPTHFPITLQVSGSAMPGADYDLQASAVEIQEAQPSISLDLTVPDDGVAEGPEFIELIFTSSCGLIRRYMLTLTDALVFNLSADTSICSPAPVQLSFSPSANEAAYPFSQETDLPFTDGPGVSSEIVVSGVPLNTLFSPQLIQSVCVNITHSWVDDLDLYLVAPDGRSITLSTDNGFNCDNYNNVCFSPSANVEIGTFFGAPPCSANVEAGFSNGTFSPEGDWSNLLEAPINGTWQLRIIDDQQGFNGTLTNWSITFSDSILYHPTITWSTGETGESITVSPSVSTTYQVSVENAFCPLTDSVTVTVQGYSALTQITGTHCEAENYSVTVAGAVYDSQHPAGTEVIPLASGCDSVVMVDLAFVPFLETMLEYVICPGECVTLPDGSEACGDGSFQFQYASVQGCDSVVSVTVTLLSPPAPVDLDAAVCFGECYTAPDGSQLCSDGDYSFILTAFSGCDSLVTVHLTVLPPMPFVNVTATVCPGECVELEGEFYCDEGVYDVIITSSLGCDSLIELTLAVFDDYPVATTAVSTPGICPGATIQLLANGGETYEWSGPGGFFTFEQNPVIANLQPNQTGVYTVVVIEPVCGLTDTDSVLLDFNCAEVFDTILLNESDTFCIGSGIPGAVFDFAECPTAGQFVQTSILPTDPDCLLLQGIGLGTDYLCVAYTQNGTFQVTYRFIVTVIQPNAVWEPAAGELLLAPNPASDLVEASWQGIEVDRVEIFDPAGRLVQSLSIQSSPAVLSLKNLPSGMYLLRFTTNQGILVKRVLKT